MALTFNSGLTNITLAEAADSGSWSEIGGGPASAQETDFFIQGTESRSRKASNSIKGMLFDIGAGNEVDMTVTGRHLYIWLLCNTPGAMDTMANGGLRIRVGSSLTDWNEYFVAGSDTHDGAWQRFVMDLNKTPSASAGTIDLTSVRYFGGQAKTVVSVKANNLGIDRIDYGQAALQVIGDGSLVADWEALFTEDDNISNKFGIIQKKSGVFFLLGGITFGDSAQGASTTFDDDTAVQVRFVDSLYYQAGLKTAIDAANLYLITREDAAGQPTSVTFGNVVGTGDDRQGVQGGSIGTDGPTWKFDLSGGLANASSSNDIFGLSISGASLGVLFDDGNKTVVISCTFVNCGEVTLGTTNNGAEILSCAFIDPDNYALQWANTTHNIKKLSFITSGTPTTQNMIHFTQSTDYSTSFDGIQFFGSYASATIRHGENTGTNADITINSVSGSGSNPIASEFNNTAGGTVIVVNTVTLKVTVKDEAGVAIVDAQTAIFDGTTELMNEDTIADGTAEQDFEYPGSDVNVSVRVRKGSATTTKYIPVNSPQLIISTGLDVTVTLIEDVNNAT